MPTYIALLRGINVGGHRKIPMADLREVFEKLKFTHVRTYIQSGNVIFDAPGKPAPVADAISKMIFKTFGFDVTVILRTPRQLRSVVDGNPFGKDSRDHAHVTFLSEIPKALPTAELDAARSNGEQYVIVEADMVLSCPGGYGRTKLSNPFIERKLKTLATTRNWKTVLELLRMSEEK